MEHLSLESHGTPNVKTLQALHKELLNVLQQAEKLAAAAADAGPPLLAMQKLTGCSRREAQYYLQQAKFNLQSAVIQWHNQVLRDYLTAYQSSFPDSVSFRQHEKREAADSMRSQAKKAADAAERFEPTLAADYLRTNFCAICKVERAAADQYLAATYGNLLAAVEEYIARHLLPPGEAADPDASLAESGALVSRSTTAGSHDGSQGSAAASMRSGAGATGSSALTAGAGAGAAGAGAAGAAPVQSAVYRAIGALSAVERELGVADDGSGSSDGQAAGTLRTRYAATGH